VRAYPAITAALAGDAPLTHGVEAASVAKECTICLAEEIDAPLLVSQRALDAALAGAQVLVLRNTVADAVATQRALESIAAGHGALLFRVEGVVTLHHARFTGDDRKKLDLAIEERLGKDAPRAQGSIVVATQTVQQSLDLDADLLITDICPMDVLLQRIGRLHRHARAQRPTGFADPCCVLLDPGAFGTLLRADGQVRSQHGFGSVYEDLRVLEATRDVCLARPLLAIPKDNRWLVEQTTHPEALAAVVKRGGAAFEAHARKVDVSAIVQRQIAALHVVDREKHFGEYAFPDRETSGRIATRLGESDRLIEFEQPFRSAFGSWVRQLKIPHWMARELPAQPQASANVQDKVAYIRVTDAAGAIGARFVYDRLGLRAATAEETDADE
jgi:CRISPR-associated endonuclease/helicase Cas3